MDQANVMEFFEAPVRIEDPATAMTTAIGRVHLGRLKASKFFFRVPEVKKDKKLWDTLKALSAHYRSYLGQRMLSEKLRRDMETAAGKTNELERQMDDLIHRAALTYTTIESPGFRAEMIMGDNAALSGQMKEQIMRTGRL